MSSNDRGARRQATSVGLAAGAVVTAAMIGVGTAHADDLDLSMASAADGGAAAFSTSTAAGNGVSDIVPSAMGFSDAASVLDGGVAASATTPAELLGEANGALTQANQVLSQAELSNVSDQSTVETFLTNEIQFQDYLLQQNGSILTTQEHILANANPLGSNLDTALFTEADQGIYQADEGVLSVDQDFDTSLASQPPGTDTLPLFLPSLELLGAYGNADFVDIIGGLIQGL
jgi:hypothetical protein